MSDLPDLPFELVLSYLSLEDVIKSRAVSRTWKMRIDNYRVKSLCFSSCLSGFIEGKTRWISGAFSQNFISDRFPECFFFKFKTILSNLKHLRLCGIRAGPEFAFRLSFIEWFRQLQELDIFHPNQMSSRNRTYDTYGTLELSMPMLRRIHLEGYDAFYRMTLDAPRLQEIRMDCEGKIKLVHAESVERVAICNYFFSWNKIRLKHLKNLKQLYINSSFVSYIDPALLSHLEKLKEVYVNNNPREVKNLFEQKQRYGRADLKVYFGGLLLNGPEDPVICSRTNSRHEWFVHLAENHSKLADEIPYQESLCYSIIEGVAPEVATNVLKRMIDLNEVYVNEPVQDIERFLSFLKNFDKITKLQFQCDQPQELFDRLPEHCAVQKLIIHCPPPDLQFLFRLEHLIRLHVYGTFDAETIRKIFEELKFISLLNFYFANKRIEIDIGNGLRVSIGESPTGVFRVSSSAVLLNVKAAIKFIVKNTRSGDSRWKAISRKLFSI